MKQSGLNSVAMKYLSFNPLWNKLKLKCIYKSSFLIVFLVGLTFQLSYAQSAGNKKSIVHAFHKDRMKRIDQVIDNAIKNNEIPGAVVLFSKNGQIAFHKSYGYANIDSLKPMQLNSIFRIASMTKAITTVGILILYEQGHFMLNDPVSKFIPEFKNPSILSEVDSAGNIINIVSAKKEIRIIDLLTHTSGIAYPFLPTKLQKVYKNNNLIDAVTDENLLLKDEMIKLAKLPLLFEPGTQYQYGLSLDVLGYLIEVISGKSLNQFFEDEIFIPLNMSDTHFYLPENKSNRLVTLYSWKAGQGLIESKGNESPIKINNPKFPIEGAKSYFSGGGGLCSTANDYWRFCQMLLNNGELEGVELLSRKSVELIESPRTDVDKDGIPDLGLTLGIINNLGKMGELGTPGSFFGAGAFYGMYWIDPKEDLVAIFLSQVMPSVSNVSLKFHTMVYQALQ